MNTAIFQYFHSFAGQSIFLDNLIIFCAKYLPYLMVAALSLFLVLSRDRRQELKMILYAVASAVLARLVITEIIRYFYYSPRPFMVFDFTPLLYDFAGSFPSGHAAFFFALATIIFLFHKKWGIAYFTGTFIICISRIMAGVHWPSDILGGMIVGIGSALLLIIIVRHKTKF
jgi:undecaprenyl-diphosphatase